ncbi:hypothetical protein ACFQE7_02950 [Nonomuraea ferruginea]|uniref:hypothetical protein n=1 Tax=Nonomuraea ferruginea TaxID=46174 RepID=UPI0036180798
MAAKTVAEKLLVKPGGTVWISAGEHRPLVGPLPEGADYVEDLGEAAVGCSSPPTRPRPAACWTGSATG